MDARRFTGVVGIAWVAVTAVGIGMFVAAGPPPSFGESTAYANFTSASGRLFLGDAFATGISAALLLAFFVGLSAVLREAVGKASLTETLVFGYGVGTAALLALVGLFETVTVYVGRTPAYSALAAPLWMLTQT